MIVGTKRCAFLSLVMIALLTIFLWQVLVPGTAYRYWLCQLGSKNTMERIQFRYKPSGYIGVCIVVTLVTSFVFHRDCTLHIDCSQF